MRRGPTQKQEVPKTEARTGQGDGAATGADTECRPCSPGATKQVWTEAIVRGVLRALGRTGEEVMGTVSRGTPPPIPLPLP